MADLSAIIKQMQLAYKPTTDKTIAGINKSYAGQSLADKSVYNSSLAQAKQTLQAVPSQFNGERNAADITKNQAMSLLPANLANAGAAADSGANYVARTNVGNTFQDTMGTIGKSQDAAKLAAQNSISELNANESASQAKLDASKAADLANAYTTAANNAISNGYSQYNTLASQEQAAAEAAATLAYKYSVAKANGNTTASKNYVNAVNGLNNMLKNDYVTGTTTTTSGKNSLTGKSNGKSSSTTSYIINDPNTFLSAVYSDPRLSSDAQVNSYINSVSGKYKVRYVAPSGKVSLISLRHYTDILRASTAGKAKK